MQSDHIKAHIQGAVDFIETNINRKISIDNISNHVYLSKFHLQRLFKSMTGKGIMEYARSRKLTESLYCLVNTPLKIVDISRTYGFEYEQTFTRAFRAEYRMSPTEYREDPKPVGIMPKADPSLLVEVDRALIVKPFHMYRPSFMIGGVLNKVGIADNLENFKATDIAVDFFHNKRQRIAGAVNPDVYYGFTYWDHNRGQYTLYVSGLEVDNDSVLPDDFHTRVIPASNYTVFRFIGFFPPEQITWKHLLHFWDFKDGHLLPGKPVDWDNHFHLEYVDWSLCRTDYCELDYYVPVV